MILECGICGEDYDTAIGHVCAVLLVVPVQHINCRCVMRFTETRTRQQILSERFDTVFGSTDPRL